MSIPELGKWAKYQRDQYVLYLRGKPSKMTPSKIDKLITIGFEDSIEERAVVVAAAASGSLTNGDVDEVGGVVDIGGIGGGEGNRDEEGEEYEEEEDEAGGDKEDEEGESEYAPRLDDSMTYHHHQQQHLGDGYAFDAPQQQYPLPGGIGDVTLNSYGVGDGGNAQNSTQQSGLLDPFHYPQGE
jgi:cobalamin biosynthesis protein CobT